MIRLFAECSEGCLTALFGCCRSVKDVSKYRGGEGVDGEGLQCNEDGGCENVASSVAFQKLTKKLREAKLCTAGHKL